jgi:hypothetical protein
MTRDIDWWDVVDDQPTVLRILEHEDGTFSIGRHDLSWQEAEHLALPDLRAALDKERARVGRDKLRVRLPVRPSAALLCMLDAFFRAAAPSVLRPPSQPAGLTPQG